MSTMRFEWDEWKNRSNVRKHGVSFEEARTAFMDDNARVLPDPDHSDDEERFVLLGLSISLRVLVVCHCYRQGDEVMRLVSARKADREEIKQYQWWIR
ncbi:MAG: BrnT family toxin [Steroidobacteraceae bacterium]